MSRLLVVTAFFIAIRCDAQEAFPLAGEWRFALDRADVGVNEKWFSRELPDKIQLPGALQSQGFGDEISTNTPWVLSLYDKLWFLRADYTNYAKPGAVKVPFLCQPPRHYLGAAWYQRDIEIPTNWAGKSVALFLERPHWESQVWFDDKPIGTNNSLCAPHEFDIGSDLQPGKHTLTVRVDNRMLMPYRPDAHSVSDSLGESWNGIAGRIELKARGAVSIERILLAPDLVRKGVDVTVFTRNESGSSVDASLVMLQVVPKNFGGNALKPVQQTATIAPGGGELNLFFPMGDNFERWSEFNPKFYNLRATIAGKGFHSEVADVFGMRELKADGNKFVLNGQEIYFRATHHGGDFPLTGYPPTDVGYWKKLFITCREWGLNSMRFHSFCPPEAAFAAADEIGVYLAIEPGMWNTISPGTPMEEMLYAETERILKAYGNHPSFALFSASNEPKGRWKEALPKWAAHFHEKDARHLYTSGTGFTDADSPGPLDRVDYTATSRFGPRQVRGTSGWFGSDYARALQGVKIPVVTHEIGQWCAYPDFDVIKKFTGYARPGNYEIFRDSAEANGLFGAGTNGAARPANRDFAWASGRFQLACYKEEIEANLRTPGLSGFQLLDLHDYTGQGTALVGLLDPLWERKSYATPAEFKKFCNTVVPLAWFSKRVLTTGEKLTADIGVANFGAETLSNAIVRWEVTDRTGKIVGQSESLSPADIPTGFKGKRGEMSFNIEQLRAPSQYRLVVKVESARGTFQNDWNFWVYPGQTANEKSANVLVTSSWDEAESKLAEGGKVLFLPRNADLDWSSPPLDSVPIFWNRLMNPGWTRMLGLWCDTNHPALAEFPTDANCDWQWTQITRGTRAVNIGKLPRELTAIVAAIDDWNRNWKLAPIFECSVGKGKLLVCSFDVTRNLNERTVARQLRQSLLAYAASGKFQPKVAVTPEQLRGVWFDSLVMRNLSATAGASSGEARNAIDGDPNTFWTAGGSGRGGDGRKHPHELTIIFPTAVAMNGVVLMNRQNDRDHLGDIRNYTIQLSADGQNWREAATGELPSTWSPREIRFSETVTAKALKLTALSGYGSDTSSALAELAIIYAGPKLTATGGEVEYRRVRSTSSDVEESSDAGQTNRPAR